jgi:uncharacterized membrane protein
MTIYNIVLFLHVIGAVGYFVGMGIWLFILVNMRRGRQMEQVRTLINMTNVSGPFTGVSVLFILVTGFYMAITSWGLQTDWIRVALISLVVMVPLGGFLIEPRRRALVRLARETPDGPLPPSLQQRIHDPILSTAIQTVIALLLGIVFLMTTKPAFAAAIIVMVVALALGLASGLLVSGMARMRGEGMYQP